MPQSPAQGSFTPANTYYHSKAVTYHHDLDEKLESTMHTILISLFVEVRLNKV